MGKCKYNKEWKSTYQWLAEVEGDNEKAKCTLCNKEFSVSNKGIADVKQHHQSNLHRGKQSAAAGTVAIDKAFQSKVNCLWSVSFM